ncbi:putative galactosylceramide sulfotransferase isoform X2 [Apostichopus japonicus]|uniref:Putative galactosylceramide sulfotransferase isoform X2 n=1 Tax=Stichopus japonicus TaxID=307972 RepID=A0A2G8JNS9_STIJA|nr:putative galactosylceramide sulfotransferase isoform X2 [Apostichopus japonicus]
MTISQDANCVHFPEEGRIQPVKIPHGDMLKIFDMAFFIISVYIFPVFVKIIVAISYAAEYLFSIISSFLCSFISQFLTIRSASGHHNGSDENGRIYNLTSMKLAVVHAQPCESIQRIVFLKTHKTASTTSASLFQRYGYYRNLTFAVGRNHILSFSSKFSRRNVLNFPGMRGKAFDMLANHARYNRGEMDLVVPNATYVTIIRRPEDQLESAFGYFEMYRGMNLSKDDHPLRTFMENPMKYYENHKYHMWQLSRNGQLFDLGLDRQMQENKSFIEQFIIRSIRTLIL